MTEDEKDDVTNGDILEALVACHKETCCLISKLKPFSTRARKLLIEELVDLTCVISCLNDDRDE